MRFSSYNMEGRIKSKTKFINEGVAECFNSVKYNNHYMLNKHDIDIFEIWNNYDSYDRNYSNFIACKFCTKLLEQGGKDNFLKLIYEQTISKAEEIYGSLLYDIKNEVEGCVCEFVGRMIYIQAGQSLTSKACSTVGGAN